MRLAWKVLQIKVYCLLSTPVPGFTPAQYIYAYLTALHSVVYALFEHITELLSKINISRASTDTLHYCLRICQANSYVKSHWLPDSQ